MYQLSCRRYTKSWDYFAAIEFEHSLILQQIYQAFPDSAIGLIGYRVPGLTTPYPPHFLINLTIDKGLGCNRRRPLPIPTLLRVEGGDFRDTLNLGSRIN